MKKIELKLTKTYATEENADKAVKKLLGDADLRYFVMPTKDGRFYPVFVGQSAIQANVHFHFHCIA